MRPRWPRTKPPEVPNANPGMIGASRTLPVTFRAHGFKLQDQDGMQQAKSTLDLASAQVVATRKAHPAAPESNS